MNQTNNKKNKGKIQAQQIIEKRIINSPNKFV
jgi:hypothetical protein